MRNYIPADHEHKEHIEQLLKTPVNPGSPNRPQSGIMSGGLGFSPAKSPSAAAMGSMKRKSNFNEFRELSAERRFSGSVLSPKKVAELLSES